MIFKVFTFPFFDSQYFIIFIPRTLKFDMKPSLLLFKLLFIGAFLFVTSCDLKPEEGQGNQDPERLERAAREKRRREDNLRRQELQGQYYDKSNDDYDSYASTSGSYEYDITSDVQDTDNKWRRVDYPDFEAYFEYGYANQALEGIIMIKKVGKSFNFPELQIGDKATKIERTYQSAFPNHSASGFTCKDVDFGDYHNITLYYLDNKGSTYVDVEAIYSVDIDGEMFIILVENGGNVTQNFLNIYEDFVEQLFIMK